MKNEEAIAFLEQYIGPEVYTEKCISAHAMGISALKQNRLINAEKMEPLTPEQLREMDGKPVWVKMKTIHELTGWAIVHMDYQMDAIRLWEKGGNWLRFNSDEMDVYAYSTAHIDREAWTAEWVKHDGYTECSKCEHWYDSPENEDEGDRPVFCPSCGRAVTPEAWDELEKRMGVMGVNGKWIPNTDEFTPKKRCTNCGYNKPIAAGECLREEPEKYCPNCGAKMEE
ncbi:hypothetical protein ACTQ33_01005 [Candidatus Avoscillospira sp. LCP25S3_F1]|uniref:hypothetical protein n=1 Tax=Candidatus Avoscillospira sp. LCP25S3_F1 TaxID=3438825 RepID=UPI003F9142C3